MKRIKYTFAGSSVEMDYSEANEEIAKREAYNGEYTVEDDGEPEPEAEATPSQEDRLMALEAGLAELVEGLEKIRSLLNIRD